MMGNRSAILQPPIVGKRPDLGGKMVKASESLNEIMQSAIFNYYQLTVFPGQCQHGSLRIWQDGRVSANAVRRFSVGGAIGVDCFASGAVRERT
jgi:hypothetical protein